MKKEVVMLPSIQDFKVGDEVVVMTSYFDSFVPINCNSQNSEAHPCRSIIEKIGRKLIYVKWTSCKEGAAPLTALCAPSAAATSNKHTCFPVAQAKEIHRKNFEGADEWRTPEFINDIINRL